MYYKCTHSYVYFINIVWILKFLSIFLIFLIRFIIKSTAIYTIPLYPAQPNNDGNLFVAIFLLTDNRTYRYMLRYILHIFQRRKIDRWLCRCCRWAKEWRSAAADAVHRREMTQLPVQRAVEVAEAVVMLGDVATYRRWWSPRREIARSARTASGRISLSIYRRDWSSRTARNTHTGRTRIFISATRNR